MRRRMKLFTMALSSLLCSVPRCTSASVASGSLLATIGACTADAALWSSKLVTPSHSLQAMPSSRSPNHSTATARSDH